MTRTFPAATVLVGGTSTMPDDRLHNLVAQHAETARLMGVDFVPAYSRSGKLPPAQPPPARAESELLLPAAAPARDRAAAQRALDDIRARYERDAPHRQFVTSFTNIVFGEGDPCARLMFVGEAPGEEEDKTGRPFVGRAGQLLDKMIHAMGLRREDVYIANVLKTRPPNNATPTTEEALLCAPYLFSQIQAIAPEVIVTLGLPATRLLLDSQAPLGQLRAKWHVFRDPAGRLIPVMPTYHPAYLLRNYTPAERAKVWSDLQQVMKRLGLTSKEPPTPAGDPAEA